jgi:hypothetical protein
MLTNTKTIYGTAVEASDGVAATVSDVYFDGKRWDVRYLVLHTGNWLNARRVLIPPGAIEHSDWIHRRILVGMTAEELETARDISTQLPLNRQKDLEGAKLLAWEAYWAGVLDDESPSGGDSHLRSTKAVAGRPIEGTDGKIGHVDNFILDDDTWTIRYVVVGTRHWWPGKRVLIEPRSVESIDWDARVVRVAMRQSEIERSPEYNPRSLLPVIRP